MMMIRQQRIDEFLEELVKIHKDNHVTPTLRGIYNLLTYYDLDKDEQNISYIEYFDKWINYFAYAGDEVGNPVYYTDWQKGFLQFNNYPRYFDQEGNHHLL